MSDRIHTILIIGAGGGIGEAMARKFHHLGKKIIVTGRKKDQEAMRYLARDLPGLELRVWDLTHLDQVQPQVASILAIFPRLDSVFINAGIQNHYHVFLQPPDNEEVMRELTTNLIAPIMVAQAFAPHLFALAQSGTKTNLFLTSSSLAYFPVPFYPTYCASKAGIAAFIKTVRAQLRATGCENMNVIEVVPPYVDTPLNEAHRSQTDALQGGKEKSVQPMPLKEYIDSFFTALWQTEEDGSFKDEVGVGFGAQGAEVWNEGYLKLLNASGMVE